MKNQIILLCLAFILCTSVSSFGITQTPMKEWTILVYLNADNDLDEHGVQDQYEMVDGGGSNEWRNVVTLIDRLEGPATLNYIESNGIKKLKDMGELDMGDYKTLINFVSTMTKAYPAKNYCLIVWNHGSGWYKNKNKISKGVSYDASSGHYISPAELNICFTEIKKVLGRKLDLLAFDACLMQMIENCYELNGKVHYLVGSAHTEPLDGYCYDNIFYEMKSGIKPVEFAKLIVEVYTAAYNHGCYGYNYTTHSAIDCSKIDNILQAIETLSKITLEDNYSKDIYDTVLGVQEYNFEFSLDLHDFAERLESRTEHPPLKLAAKNLKEAVESAVIIRGHTGNHLDNEYGLAAYFPWYPLIFDPDYLEINYCKATLWDEMMLKYYKEYEFEDFFRFKKKQDIEKLRKILENTTRMNVGVNNHLTAKLNFQLFVGDYKNIPEIHEVLELLKNLKD